MELIPAIDLLDGQVVRLHKGDYSQVTVYSSDPVAQARVFHQAGATRLHVVDLAAARDGRPHHADLIAKMVGAVPIAVQVGGGIRDVATAERWFDAGAARVVLGTAAVQEPQVVAELCAAHPEGVVVAVDARHGEVAVKGWTEGAGISALELARRMDALGVAAILHTAIERDGTREGPDIGATVALQTAVRADVIASGGIGTLEHVRALASQGVRSAVCGRALLAGAFELTEAIALARQAGDGA